MHFARRRARCVEAAAAIGPARTSSARHRTTLPPMTARHGHVGGGATSENTGAALRRRRRIEAADQLRRTLLRPRTGARGRAPRRLGAAPAEQRDPAPGRAVARPLASARVLGMGIETGGLRPRRRTHFRGDCKNVMPPTGAARQPVGAWSTEATTTANAAPTIDTDDGTTTCSRRKKGKQNDRNELTTTVADLIQRLQSAATCAPLIAAGAFQSTTTTA